MKNNILILAALLVLASCSQKQFSFRKTIKVNQPKQQELVLDENKEDESTLLVESENTFPQEIAIAESIPAVSAGNDMMMEANQQVEQPKMPIPETYTPPVAVKEKKSIEKLLPSKIEQKLNKKSGGDGSTAAILGFVFGLLGVIFLFTSSPVLALLSLLLLIAGIVLSIIGLNSDSRVFAIIGLIFNILGLVIWLLAIIFVAALLSGGA
jgi:hypothetical protein